MPVCSSCTAVNPEGYRFCGECGAILEAGGCPVCGAAHDPDQRFCGQCGANLSGARPETAGHLPERKLATVLFADVVGFTSLAERTDPEIVARMVDAAFQDLGEVVVEHGGTIDKYMGDSLMAVFGVPVAHDDDAERAIAAALAMRKLGGDLVFSIGVNSGEVMATPIGGSGDVTVIGDTVNVAARLEKAAGPGEVLCGRLTAELVGERALFRQKQPVVLKGKSEPVEVWEAIEMRSRRADAAGRDLPLIGRDDELAYLASIWHRVRRESVYEVAILSGDSGVGKSRLAAELVETAAGDGHVVWATYPAYGPTGGMQVAAELLRQLGPAGSGDVTSRVKSMSGAIDPSLVSIDPEGLRKEQLWALVRFLEEKGSATPLLIVVDDFHHTTETTLQMVSELQGRLAGAALLLLLVGRDEPSEWLTRFSAATRVRLGPLGRADAALFAGELVCDKPLAEEATDFLVERSGGNPLYLRELIRLARATGTLVDDGACYRLGGAGLPPTLHALLAARLDALRPAHKQAFQHLAVIGQGATAAQLAALGAPDAVSSLGALIESGLVKTAPGDCYEASDPLLSEVAYETLPRTTRGELHRRAASNSDSPEERARHLERAAEYLSDDKDLAKEAAGVLGALGLESARAARYPEARRLLERAMDLGSRSPALIFALAEVQSVSGEPDAALAALSLIEDDPDDPAVAIERDHAAARVRIFGEPAAALELLPPIAERWRAAGMPLKQAWALANAGVAAFNISRMEMASANLEAALALFEEVGGDKAGEIAASSFLCLVRPADSRVPGWLANALEFAETSGDRLRQMTALSPLAWLHSLRSMWGCASEIAEAEGFARRLASVAEEIGAFDVATHGRSLLAILARWSGRLDVASDHVRILDKLLERPDRRDPWLAWAVCFSVAVAGGNSSAAPPFPPSDYVDPVGSIAAEVIEAELAFSGRVEEAVAHIEHGGLDHGPVADAAAVLKALTFLLAGRREEARLFAERSAAAAAQLGALPAKLMADSLLAELSGDPAALPEIPEDTLSAAGAVVLRAHAALGDGTALQELDRVVKVLAMPGLLIGLPAS
ncbi:MAG TPA: adenylate/guanylate cyclase domain-containing protein [Acidimicrobiales bacterium]|nr:adenylate/guanylate cyclase domain-containing protein [Acidimicrobiales bacterium]